jgi:hypothetical protein
MKRSVFTLCLLVLIGLTGTSQLLTENFNTGLPVTWQQSPVASWSLNPSFGISGSSCIVTENIDSAPGTRTISTPTLNLNGVANLTVSFQVAAVKNNFIHPDLVLYYNNGSGPQFLARWGSGFSSNTTYTLTALGTDYTPPLDVQNVSWEACSHTIAAISGTAVSFMFEADLFNGGYVLLDDIVISGITSTITALSDSKSDPELFMFQNPLPDKKLELKQGPIKQVWLTDLLGRSFSPANIREKETGRELDLSNLPAGIYYIYVVTEGKEPLAGKILLE